LTTLLPAIIEKSRGKPIEFHSNNLLGQSAKSYLDAVDLGVTILHTSIRPMANGPSVPSTEIMVRNLELLGHTHDLDTSLLSPVADHFEKVGKAAGFLVNQYAEYDVLSIQHQVPGGMIGTLKAQLAQQDMMDRLDDVLTETAVVRKELGYPGMATPFSQLVGTQAVLNIVTGKRYSVVPDEVIQYAAKFYGEPAGPIDPNIMDRIMSSPRGKEVSSNPPPQPSIEDLRKQYGTDDDDELILRALVPEADLNKMWAAGPVKKTYPLLSSPELDQVRRLMSLAQSPVVQVKLSGFELSLRRGH
jgi:oxaloacetate decarboxylase alpha subunit